MACRIVFRMFCGLHGESSYATLYGVYKQRVWLVQNRQRKPSCFNRKLLVINLSFKSVISYGIEFSGHRAIGILLGLLHDADFGRILQRSHWRRYRHSCSSHWVDSCHILDTRVHLHIQWLFISIDSSHCIQSRHGLSTRWAVSLDAVLFCCSIIGIIFKKKMSFNISGVHYPSTTSLIAKKVSESEKSMSYSIATLGGQLGWILNTAARRPYSSKAIICSILILL